MSEDQASHWRNLKSAAMSGQLRLEEDLGEAMVAVINRYIEDLEQQKFAARSLEYLTGWGSLPSAQTIRHKMEQKAVAGGADDPDDSAIKRLDQHIAIARDQRDTFLAAIGQLQNTDQQSADTIMNGQR